MNAQNTNNSTVNCINEHDTKSSEHNITASITMLDYDTELNYFISTLVKQEQYFKFIRDKIFIGVGDQGSKIIRAFHMDRGRLFSKSSFLVIDLPGDVKPPVEIDKQPAREVECNSPILFHHLTALQSKQTEHYGPGEKKASSDTQLNDFLLRTGINAADGQQTIFLISPLNERIGNGISPFIVQSINELNPESNKMLISVMPAADEPDSIHFNAFCSLSRLIKPGNVPSTDIILLIDQSSLLKSGGINSAGNELLGEDILSYMIDILAGTNVELDQIQTDIGYISRTSRSMGITAFTPCVSAGRSLEIFGNLTNLLESALASPLSSIDKDSIMLSVIIVQIPKWILSWMKEGAIKAEINKWNKSKFHRLKGSIIQISELNKKTDRIDLCILLGGNKLGIIAKNLKEGFDRFKAIAEKEPREQQDSTSISISMTDIDQAISWHDSHLDKLGE